MLAFTLKFVRVKILITCLLITLLGSLSAGSVSVGIVWSSVILIAWYINAASTNDYADREIDKINLAGVKNRPLLQGSVPLKNIVIVATVSALVSLLFSALYGASTVILSVIILVLNYAYSFAPFRIKDRVGLAQIILPLAYVVYPFSLGYWSTQSSEPYQWLLMFGLYLGFIARLFLKDFRDVVGDKKFGKKTFVLAYGRHATCMISWICATVSLAILSYAIDFSIGTMLIFITGHSVITMLLKKIADTEKINEQVALVMLIAKIANISVVSLLVYYFSKTYLTSNIANSLLPFIAGVTLFIILKNKIQTDSDVLSS